MRRKDREMDKDFALSVIERCQYATLALVCEDKTPYCIPLSPAQDGDALYFHCAPDGKKTACMRAQPSVCVSCVGEVRPVPGKFTIEFESAVVFGTASEVTEAEEKIHALRLICERYTPDNMANFDAAIEKSLHRTAVWKVQMDEMTGKRKKYDSAGVEMKFGRME